MKNFFTIITFILSAASPLMLLSQSWANDNGGVYNIPAEEYNPRFHGYGSTDNKIYNKIDLQNGQKMLIENPNRNESSVPLYDFMGKKVDDAWNSPIGRDIGNIEPDGYTFRDGGIIAASIAQIRVGNTNHTMVYAWSVNTRNSGRRSGWIKLTDLKPSNTIKNILEDTKDDRMDILVAAGINRATYDEYNVVSAFLPSSINEYYLPAGRSASKTAGKARFYYTVEEPDGNYISGVKNIPETSRQRFGVANNNIPVGAKFYRDRNYPTVRVNIYPPSSFVAVSHQLEFAWGYTVSGAGEKIYSFINRRALVATGDNDVTDNEREEEEDNGNDNNNGNSNIVHITKRNASNFALDGGNGASNNQNVRLWAANKNAVNQQWEEISRGNGYFSYQKVNTNHCLDGGDGGRNKQNVLLWPCNANSTNQQWKKQATDGGAYKLIKRNASGYAVDGGSGGSNGQNVGLYDSGNPSHNLQWFIASVDGSGTTTTSVKNIAPDGRASQSSTEHGGSASRAIDKNKSGVWGNGSVTHTKNTNRPHWEVEWNNVYKIDQVKIYNRTDCCTNRLSDFKVFVINDQTGQITFSKTYSSISGSSLTINTNGAKGDRVKIRLNGANFLSLAEVEVYGALDNVNTRSADLSDTYIRATKEMGRKVALDWRVNADLTPVQYDVEYSANDGAFELLESLSATEFDQGNVFEYIHNSPEMGDNNYRVKVLYQDSSENYLFPRSINFESTIESLVFPNPANGQIFVDLSSLMGREVELFLTSSAGQVNLTTSVDKDHEELLEINVSELQNGLYVLYIKGENRRAIAEKVSILNLY